MHLLFAIPALLTGCDDSWIGLPVADAVAETASEADSGAPTGGDDTGDAGGQVLTGVTWRVAWDETGLLEAEDGAWRIERDDGAAFELREGWVVLYALVLESCEEEPGEGPPPPHGLPTHLSAETRLLALPLHELEPVELGTYAFDAERFCEAGVTLFRGADAPEGLPDDPALADQTLWLEGRLRVSRDAEWQDVVMKTGISTEADLALDGASGETPVVEARLRPAALLDGVPLDQHPDRAAMFALPNLAAAGSAVVLAE